MFIIKQIFFGSRIYFHSQNKLICESFILIDGNGVVSYETDGIGNDASHNAVSDYSNQFILIQIKMIDPFNYSYPINLFDSNENETSLSVDKATNCPFQLVQFGFIKGEFIMFKFKYCRLFSHCFFKIEGSLTTQFFAILIFTLFRVYQLLSNLF